MPERISNLVPPAAYPQTRTSSEPRRCQSMTTLPRIVDSSSSTTESFSMIRVEMQKRLSKIVPSQHGIVASDQEAFRQFEQRRKAEGDKRLAAVAPYIISPLSPQRRLWDMITALFVIYYCWSIPFQIGFDWYQPSAAMKDWHK